LQAGDNGMLCRQVHVSCSGMDKDKCHLCVIWGYSEKNDPFIHSS